MVSKLDWLIELTATMNCRYQQVGEPKTKSADNNMVWSNNRKNISLPHLLNYRKILRWFICAQYDRDSRTQNPFPEFKAPVNKNQRAFQSKKIAFFMIIVVINHSSISITEERLESDLVAGPCVKKSCLGLILTKTPWHSPSENICE